MLPFIWQSYAAQNCGNSKSWDRYLWYFPSKQGVGVPDGVAGSLPISLNKAVFLSWSGECSTEHVIRLTCVPTAMNTKLCLPWSFFRKGTTQKPLERSSSLSRSCHTCKQQEAPWLTTLPLQSSSKTSLVSISAAALGSSLTTWGESALANPL